LVCVYDRNTIALYPECGTSGLISLARLVRYKYERLALCPVLR
jgi:hypothetical protein